MKEIEEININELKLIEGGTFSEGYAAGHVWGEWFSDQVEKGLKVTGIWLLLL